MRINPKMETLESIKEGERIMLQKSNRPKTRKADSELLNRLPLLKTATTYSPTCAVPSA